MPENRQQRLSQSVLALLRPLVRILLRNGIAYDSFAELAKKVYVDVAYDDFAPEGKKQSISHVSALTGMTRKEAKRLRELQHTEKSDNRQRYNRATRVISGWVNDDEFRTASGKPASLALEGRSGSFSALVKKYSGDITPRAMLTALETAKSVRVTNGRARLVTQAYLPGKDSAEKIAILGTDTAELIATIDHNLVSREETLRFQRKVSNTCLRTASLPRFQALAARRSQSLLENLDAWLSEHEVDPADTDEDKGCYVSLGIYFFEKSTDEEEPS